MEKNGKKMGWEVARELEAEKATMVERAKLSGEQIKTMLIYAAMFIVLFLCAIWLAGNPFEFTQRIPSAYVKAKGFMGTDSWTIVWWVVICCAFFEYMDSAGGMGYGTALTPLMLMAGFDPKQVVPCVMITEMFTGIIAGAVHGEFENVEWKFNPMNETTKMVVTVAIIGMIAVGISITAVYKIFAVHKFWIKLYVAMLLIVMGICSLLTARKVTTYRPKWMVLFAAVAGFNKGIGGGGYGPVVTVGGLLAGSRSRAWWPSLVRRGLHLPVRGDHMVHPAFLGGDRGLPAAALIRHRHGHRRGGGPLHHPDHSGKGMEDHRARLLLPAGHLRLCQIVAGYFQTAAELMKAFAPTGVQPMAL